MKQSRRQGGTHWLRNTIIVLLICGMAGTILAAIQFNLHPDRTSASASLQFSFDNAAMGNGPNYYPFNVDGLSSDEVLEEALTSTGLEGKYTPDQLRDNLVVVGQYPENLVEQVMSYDSLMDFKANRELTVTEFHPTLFSVSLYNDFDKAISQADLEGLLAAILSSYRTYFGKTCALHLDWKDDAIYNFEDYDYLQQLEIMEEVMQQQSRYALDVDDLLPHFSKDGQGFNDVSVRMNSLIDNDVVNLNATITINALTHDIARLITQYQFEIRDLSNHLEKKTEQLDRLNKLIDSYEKNEVIYLSTSDTLTKIDGNSSETYDQLVKARKSVSDDITEIESKIKTYQIKLADLMNKSDSTSQSTAAVKSVTAGEEQGDQQTDAETMAVEEITELTKEEIEAAAAEAEAAGKRQIEALERNISTLSNKRANVTQSFQTLLNAYDEQQVNERMVSTFNHRYNTPKYLSGAFIKQIIKTAGPLCVVGFILCLIVLIINRKREMKGRE